MKLKFKEVLSNGYYNNNNGNNNDKDKDKNSAMSFAEARRLMSLVNVEVLKRKLSMEGKEVIEYSELIQEFESMGIARSNEEATAFTQVLDEAGIILLFHDKVYLRPDKVEISLSQHLCREAEIGLKVHKLRLVLVSDLVVMGILGFGFKTHAYSILTGM